MIYAFERGTFRVRGDTVEIFPMPMRNYPVRIEMFGDEIEKHYDSCIHLTGEILH